MTGSLRDMARALDDAALETLASKGLVRRAAADVAAGRASLVKEDERAAEVRVDGETAQVLADGPRLGRCSCPAPGVCRHRLAALILLREPSGDAAVAGEVRTAKGEDRFPETPPVESVDWAAVLATYTPEKLSRFAGRTVWRQALGELERAKGADVTLFGASLQVRLSPQEEPVLFLAAGGLDAALTKAPEKQRKLRVVVAALAARHAFGLSANTAEPAISPIVEAAPRPDDRTLQNVRELLRRAYTTALAFAPAALEAEIRRMALAGRIEAMPRLAASLRRLAGAFEPLRRRGADADPDAMLELMAETYALTLAMAGSTEGPGRAALIGQARQDYGAVGDLDLVGLGAKLWATPSGAHGVTAYFYGPGPREAFTLTHARADRTDTTFDPKAAFHYAPFWGSPMSRLCVAKVRVTGALVSAARRLSTSLEISAEALAWTPSVDAVGDWDCVYSDWRVLERRLQTVLAGRLTAPAPAETPVILVFRRYAPVRFDELTQRLIWPLADQVGRWIGLTLPFEGVERDRIDVLERLTARERCWAVLAMAEVVDGGVELRPYGLWGASQHLLDFPPTPSPGPKSSGDIAVLLERLKVGVGAARSGPQGLAARGTSSDRLIDRGWGLLVRGAESGRSFSRAAFAIDCRDMANEFARAGLMSIAKPFDAAAAPGAAEDAYLRAAWAIVSARRLKARLAWMA